MRLFSLLPKGDKMETKIYPPILVYFEIYVYLFCMQNK